MTVSQVSSSLILITGGSGFIGKALISHLGLKSIKLATRTDLASMQIEFNGINTLVHLAARVHVRRDAGIDQMQNFYKINTEQTLYLARRAAAKGVKRFVFISSVKVNGEITQPGSPFTESNLPAPQDVYALSKNKAEQGLYKISEDTGMEIVIIRPPLVYGPGAKANFAALICAVKYGLPLPLGSVYNQRSLVSVYNLIDFIVMCIIHPLAANQTFLVSDSHDLSTTELLRGMAKASGVPSRLFPVPVWALQTSASLLGRGDVIKRLCGNLQVDISKARSLLGWVPPVSVDEGLRRSMA